MCVVELLLRATILFKDDANRGGFHSVERRCFFLAARIKYSRVRPYRLVVIERAFSTVNVCCQYPLLLYVRVPQPCGKQTTRYSNRPRSLFRKN